MLKIITSTIREFLNVLAYRADRDPLVVRAIDKSLEILDPKGEKAKNLNTIITFNVEDPYLRRSIGFLANNANTINFRLDAFKKTPGAEDVVKIYENVKKLYDEAIDSGNKAIKSGPEERNPLLNTAVKNLVMIKEDLKKNERLIDKFQ